MSTVKTYQATAKALEGGKGQFAAIVSVWDNVDKAGDRVRRGAFAKSIARLRQIGDPVPVIHSHNWGDPFAHIGSADPEDIRETDEGLLVRGKLDIADNETAAQVWRLLRERRIKSWSFAYDIIEERRAADGSNELLALEILEVGPTLVGANPLTTTLSTKADAATAEYATDREIAELAAFAGSAPRGKFFDLGDGEILAVDADPDEWEAALLAKGFDRELVQHALGLPTPQEIAAAARAKAAEKEVAAFRAANEALALGGTLPSEAERAARISDQIEREEAERAARSRDRDSASTFHADTGQSR